MKVPLKKRLAAVLLISFNFGFLRFVIDEMLHQFAKKALKVLILI